MLLFHLLYAFVLTAVLHFLPFLQEILDQIADVDLVINFKSTEEHLEKKNLGTGNFSPCGEYLSMRTATADGGASWKEKFNVHKEQVY